MKKLHIENVHINIGAKPSMPPIGLLAALASISDDKPIKRPSDLPAIGEKWPRTEAIYAGKSLSRDGTKIVDLIFWLDESKEGRSYEDNLKYCESVSKETGSHAATRQQAIVINDNLRHMLIEDQYYWTETKSNSGNYAFVQYVGSGTQGNGNRNDEYRALAVSEIY